ncbi:hypothetical protein RFI_15114 [Reticulomyxa filosa]|uniref:Uncharacterized protein n=1 Tax=Reticulomyxa filosa TaxID=46433 RepID=X6N8L1_RETFI|nr:hypothetical protein RFI_15114 [Reticulomyxa filosa]|eukprot:ETO22089.1 hypothetical protein RFI_15114 [Reticulomyxa filosa]
MYVYVCNYVHIYLNKKKKKVFFCDYSTNIEQLECFLLRASSSLLTHLHCLIQPELLPRPLQQALVTLLPKYMHKPTCLLAIITTDGKSIVPQTFTVFRDMDALLLALNESRMFYSSVMCGSLEDFEKRKNHSPFVQVFLSQHECVGKSYLISSIQKKLQIKPKHFVHIPINTSVVDRDFIVDQFATAPVTDELMVCFIVTLHTHTHMYMLAYVFCVKSYAYNICTDVNTLMFQLLVLRYLIASNGQSFSIRRNHAILVELPTQLCKTHKPTRLSDVLKWFHFFGERINELAISFCEVLDELREAKPLYPNRVRKNTLNLNEKEQFVLKYLDALQRGELKNRDDHSPDWNYQDNEDINRARMEELMRQYCPILLQFMYRQLVQVYNFIYTRNANVPVVQQQIIPLHQMIVSSLTKSSQSIACNMYIERKDHDSEDSLQEAKGTEEFFLVQEWKTADPPLYC